MKVVFTYLPIRLKEITEIYLKYSIENLNKQDIVPIIYSDKDYFKNTKLKYDWHEFNIDDKFKINNLWSYPKLKVLSEIDYSFIHLDNDLVINNFNKLKNIIINDKLNLAYKHLLQKSQINSFDEIYQKYSKTKLNFDELNNTCIIATNDYKNVNKTYSDVLNIIDLNYDFFIKKYNNIPPITLNQQHLNQYFFQINYLYNSNPSFENLNSNGLCHLSEKNIISKFIINNVLV
jgi:hypothetical protein